MSLLPLFAQSFALAAILLTSACVGPREIRKAIPVPKPPAKPVVKGNYWKGDGVAGAPKIVISLAKQRAYFYKGGKLVGESAVSTGRKGFETPPGTYRVTQKSKDHVSNLYGDYVDATGKVVKKNADTSKKKAPEGATFRGAKMPYFLRFYQGYGMHAGRVPRHRASHGCVRLPREMARRFFENASTGTPVTVE
jgi:lipoprotein-anchoring transpeptidase ErfK/SrfK